MHILLAEDDTASRMVLEAYLKKAQLTFTSTVDGQKALDAFKKSPTAYDVIITDCMMPYMNGLELCREVKKIRPIDVIMLTAYDQDTKIKDINGIEVPWTICDYVLRKPTNFPCLVEILCNVDYDNSVRARNS